MNEESRADLLESALIAPPLRVKGSLLRPLSLGSYLLLRRTGNRLVTGEGGDSNDIEDVAGYLYAHSAPLDQVLEAAAGSGWKDAVMRWSFDLAPSDLRSAIPRIISDIQLAAASIAEPDVQGGTEPGKSPDRLGAPLPCGE